MKKIIVLLSLFGWAASAAEVSSVKVEALDGFGGDTGSVLSRCQTRAGGEYDRVTVTRDVASLRDSKEFETVEVDADETPAGVVVTFRVRRKMRYHGPIEVTGAAYFSESDIASKSELKDGFLYGEADLAGAAAKVRTAYNKKHYPDAKVEVSTIPIAGNDCRVRFTIDEGEHLKLNRVTFEGIEDPEIDEAALRKAAGDFPWWNPVGWFSDPLASNEQQVQACEPIANYYRNRGYLDVSVTGPERVPTGDERYDLCYLISEGVKYTVGEVSIGGLTRYTEEAIRQSIDKAHGTLPKAGEVAGAEMLAAAARRIEVAVGSGPLGLTDTHVAIRQLPSDADSSVLDFVFQVTEGVPVIIDEVVIRGNNCTKDTVIRREILLDPNRPMLADKAEQSKRRLENLDYFSRVQYSLVPSGRGKTADGAEYRNLVFEVEEKNTGNFMVGVGASSVDSVFLTAELSQSNFDLFAPRKLFRGAGQKGRLYASWGPRIQTYEASVTEPHLFDRQLELSVDAYRRMRWYDDYDIIRTGGSASLSYPVKFWRSWDAFGRLGFRLSGEFIEFDDVDHGEYVYRGRDVSLRQEERKYGDAFEPVLRVFWAKDSRNSFHKPSSGSYTQLFADVAPFGDNTFWRLGVNHRSYFSVWERFGHVLMVGARAETISAISGDVPIYNRMFLGGPRSIRGIEYRHAAPMARKVSNGDYIPWGGQTLFCMNFEYTVPVVKDFLRLAVFTDLGSVGEDEFDLDFSDTFAWTVGLGVRIDLPMFPIRLDFATPVKKPSHADEEVFSFTVGYDF